MTCEKKDQCIQYDEDCKNPGGYLGRCFYKKLETQKTDAGLSNSTDLLLANAATIIMDWHLWYEKNMDHMPDAGLKINYASKDFLRLLPVNKEGK